jgi:hypothetical protein
MAAMCRTLGIDARVATGFVASEYNAGTDHYIVRASDAHAWVEAEIQPGVWETFDPTPTAEFERIHDPEVSFLATLRRVYDTVEFLWVRAVVAFDGGTRARLFGLPAADGAMIGEGLLRRFELARRIEPSNVAAAAAFGAGTSVVVYVAGSLVLARVRFATGFSAWLGATLRGLLLTLWASVPIRRRDAASLRDAVYREFVAMMGRAGYAKPRHEPLAAYVATCGVLDRLEEESGRTLSAIGGALYAWTYAGREPDAAAVLAALRDVRRLAGEFRKRGGAA